MIYSVYSAAAWLQGREYSEPQKERGGCALANSNLHVLLWL